MDDNTARLFAIGSGIAMIVAAVLAVARRSKPAAIITGALAVLFIVVDAPQLLQFAFDRGGFIAQYGEAAVPQLALNAWGIALGIFSLVCSWIAISNRPFAFWLGWIANIPQVALLWYLAFWFRIQF